MSSGGRLNCVEGGPSYKRCIEAKPPGKLSHPATGLQPNIETALPHSFACFQSTRWVGRPRFACGPKLRFGWPLRGHNLYTTRRTIKRAGYKRIKAISYTMTSYRITSLGKTSFGIISFGITSFRIPSLGKTSFGIPFFGITSVGTISCVVFPVVLPSIWQSKKVTGCSGMMFMFFSFFV